MNTNRYTTRLGILLMLLLLVAGILPAQEEQKEMTKDEWNAQMAEQTTKLQDLQAQQTRTIALKRSPQSWMPISGRAKMRCMRCSA